jgi:hypothetical protein
MKSNKNYIDLPLSFFISFNAFLMNSSGESAVFETIFSDKIRLSDSCNQIFLTESATVPIGYRYPSADIIYILHA